MVAARKAKRLTQKQLGARVGTSQNIVSLIEAGEIESSSYILPICKHLGIAPPQFHESEDQKVWTQLGHLLRLKNRKQFRRVLALVESMVENNSEDPASGDATSSDAPQKGERPPSRK
jgi:transcriptional regulator with XRE-family HTH domain